MLAGPKLFEGFDSRSHACFINTVSKCCTWLCEFLLAFNCNFIFNCYGMAQSVWEYKYAGLSRNCHSYCGCACRRIAFQVLVTWRNCRRSWLSLWNHNLWTCICFITEVHFSFAILEHHIHVVYLFPVYYFLP